MPIGKTGGTPFVPTGRGDIPPAPPPRKGQKQPGKLDQEKLNAVKDRIANPGRPVLNKQRQVVHQDKLPESKPRPNDEVNIGESNPEPAIPLGEKIKMKWNKIKAKGYEKLDERGLIREKAAAEQKEARKLTPKQLYEQDGRYRHEEETSEMFPHKAGTLRVQDELDKKLKPKKYGEEG